jgi:hypothetical protein
MGIDHSASQILVLVTEEFVYGADVVPVSSMEGVQASGV